MRKIINILFAWILCSCADSMNKEAIVSDEESVLLEYELDSKNLTIEKLTSEKLQNYFELIKLKNEHPKFQEDILEELKGISDEEFTKIDSSESFTIENIRMVGKGIILSDSVQKMILHYDFVSENQTKTDSIAAWIKTKSVLLEGVPKKSFKITFSPLE